jgi:hypothetical protein
MQMQMQMRIRDQISALLDLASRSFSNASAASLVARGAIAGKSSRKNSFEIAFLNRINNDLAERDECSFRIREWEKYHFVGEERWATAGRKSIDAMCLHCSSSRLPTVRVKS